MIILSSLFTVVLISTDGWIVQTAIFLFTILIIGNLFISLNKQTLICLKEMSKINQSIHTVSDLNIIHQEIYTNPYIQLFWINALFKSMKSYICDYLTQNKLKFSDFNETLLYKIFEENKEKLIHKIFKVDK